MKVKTSLFSVALLGALMSMPAFANGCDDFPTHGVDLSRIEEGRVVSTASVGVLFDDIQAINDARIEATMVAKAAIAKFLTEEIQSDEAVERIANEQSSQDSSDSASKKARVERTKKTIVNLRSHVQEVLRGVAVLGECYTPGRELRVIVGIKPQTVQGAEKIRGNINRSLQAAPSVQSVQSGNAAANGNGKSANGYGQSSGSMPTQAVPGYSNRSQLDNF